MECWVRIAVIAREKAVLQLINGGIHIYWLATPRNIKHTTKIDFTRIQRNHWLAAAKTKINFQQRLPPRTHHNERRMPKLPIAPLHLPTSESSLIHQHIVSTPKLNCHRKSSWIVVFCRTGRLKDEERRKLQTKTYNNNNHYLV